jgi:hypothetical protein
MKHKRTTLSLLIIFLFSMSYWTSFVVMNKSNNATTTINNTTGLSSLDLSSLALFPPEGGGQLYYALLDWFNVIPRYYQDVTNISYYGSFVGSYFDDPNTPGPPIGVYTGYLYDNIKKEYLGQVTTDQGALFLQRYTVQFPIMFYTKESANAIFPDVQQCYYTGTLYDLFWGVSSGERVKATLDIPYMNLSDATFNYIGDQKKDGTVLMQAWVDTSRMGQYFHDVDVYYEANAIGKLAYTAQTYAYIESIYPNKYEGGFINPNKSTIVNVLGSLPPLTEGGQVDVLSYEITAKDTWADILVKAQANVTTPYSQQYFQGVGSKEGFQVNGWYLAPPSIVMPQKGYILGATPENAKVLTYTIREDNPDRNITIRGNVIDPNLYQEYGSIDTVLFSADITLRSQVRRLDLLHIWHNEYKDIDNYFPIGGWALKTSQADYDNNIREPVGWTVDNVYILQNWTASVVVGAYYDWEPSSPNVGPLQHLTYDEGQDIFIGIPSGSYRGGGALYQIPPEILALAQALLFPDVFTTGGEGVFGTERGSIWDIILSLIIGIAVIVITIYAAKWAWGAASGSKHAGIYKLIILIVALIIIICMVYFFIYQPLVPQKQLTPAGQALAAQNPEILPFLL